MASIKLKRGQESKVASLPKEDGSLIFGYDTASTPATMQLDQNISGMVQRLNLSVANSGTSSYSKNSAALGSSSLSQILNYVNNKDIKVTQLTNQDLNTIRTPGFYYAGGGNSCTNKPQSVDSFGLEVIRIASGYYTQRLTVSSQVLDFSNTIYTRYYNASTWSAWTNTFKIKSSTSSTADISKNSNALSGSSLQNILDKINTTSGSGNAFTGLDTTTNNVVKLTRANGGTVQKTINNVAHATSADNANLLDNIDSSRFVYGNNAAAVNTNYANASSIWKSGFYDLNVTGGASNGLPTTNSWHWLIQAGHRNNSSTNRYGLQITAPNDTNGNLYFRTNPSSGAGTWKTILDSHNYTSYAANKNSYNSASISNATIKLGRSDGSTGTTLTVNNVSHATSATIATSAVSVQTFPSTLTLGSGGPAIIDQDSATYRQRIRIEDNSTSGDNVFVFQQSSDSGVSYKDLFRILDNSNVVASTFTGYLNGNAKNSNALGGSSLSQILAQSGSGNAFTGLDTATNNVIKLTRANGGTVQKTINNVANATSANISKEIYHYQYGNVAYATSDTHIMKYGYLKCDNSYQNLTLLITCSFWGNQHGSAHLINFQQDTNSNSTATIQYTGRVIRIGGNTDREFYAYKDNTNKRLYLYAKVTGGNSYGKWNVTILQSSSGFSAWVSEFGVNQNLPSGYERIPYTYPGTSDNSNALGGSSLQNILDKVNMTSGSGNAFTAIDTATNNVVKLTRANGGTVQKTIDNVSHASTSSYSSNSGQLQGHTITAVSSGSSATFSNHIPYIGGSVLEIARYIDFHGDGTSRDYSTRLDASTPSKLIVSGPSASTVTASYFEGNAKNANALGGSSLSQVLNSVSSKVGSSTYLNNCFTSRPTDANIGITGKGGIRTFKATSSMTSHKPSSDGHILHFDWDNTGGYDSQLFLQDGGSPHIQIRGMAAGTWGSWINILDQNNYTSYAAKKNAYNSASISNATIKLGRSDSSTGTTLTVNNVSHATSATISSNSNALGGSSLSQVLSSAGSGKYLPLAGGTLSGNLLFSNSGTGYKGIQGTMADNDEWRIMGAGTSSDAGFLEIATADGGNEPIYLRQYSGVFTTLKRTATLLDGNGNTSFPGIVAASSFNGMLERVGKSVTWQSGNKGDGVLINQTSYTGWNPVLRAKSSNGVWTFGPWSDNRLFLNYTSDTTIATTVNSCDKQIIIYPNGDLSGLHTVTASTFAGYLNGNAKNSNALGGSSLSQILNSITSGSVQADVATRLASSTKSVANNFTIRTGTPTSSGWTQYPIYPIYNTTDSTLTAYKGKSLSILHMDGGAYRHDIVALNGANDGLIYASATSAGTTSSRIERILDGGNYGSLITNLSKQVTFSNGLKAQTNVQMDGGNFSTGSTVTTGNGETSISNVKISVSGNTLVITTK